MADGTHKAVAHLLVSLADIDREVAARLAGLADADLTNDMSVIVLCALDLAGPKRPTAIQELTGLSSGGVTKLLDRLEQRKVIVRSYGTVPDDHRAVVVSLTPAGRKLVQKFTKAISADLADLRRQLTKLAAELG